MEEKVAVLVLKTDCKGHSIEKNPAILSFPLPKET